MHVFLAGATGVIGSRVAALLIDHGHAVTGTTRSPHKAASMPEGVTPVMVDVYDRPALSRVVERSGAEVIMHQLTDLPEEPNLISRYAGANARIRREGTDNLLAAARHSGMTRFLAQSVAWRLDGEPGEAVDHLESAVLAFGGTILRYGQFYGPGTFHPGQPPPPPRVHIDEAAAITVGLLEAGPGVVEIVEEEA